MQNSLKVFYDKNIKSYVIQSSGFEIVKDFNSQN